MMHIFWGFNTQKIVYIFWGFNTQKWCIFSEDLTHKNGAYFLEFEHKKWSVSFGI
jgi:hypothetical protein